MVPRPPGPNKGWSGLRPLHVWLAIAAGIALAVAYTLSPLTVVALALVPLILKLGGIGLPADERRWLAIVLLSAIGLRLLVIAAMFLVSDRDTQAAAILAGDEAYSLARTLRVRHILLGVPTLKYDHHLAFEEYGQTSYLTLLTVLQVLFGPSPYGLRLVNVLFFAAGALLLFRMSRGAFGRLPAFAGLAALLLLPTLFFWSISLLKEALYFLLAATVLTGAYAVLRAPRTRWRMGAALAAALALYSMADLRAGAVYLVGGGVGVGLALFAATGTARRAAAAASLLLVACVAVFSTPALRDRLASAIDRAAVMHLGHVFTVGHAYKTLDEGFYLKMSHALELTTGEAARFVVRSLRAFLVEPWPWDMATRSELAFMPEHVLWYLVVLLTPLSLVYGYRRDRLAVCLLAGIALPTMLVVALTNGNVGTLIRFRGLVWPYLLVLAGLGVCVLLERALGARTGDTLESALARSVVGRSTMAAGRVVRTAAARSRLLGISRQAHITVAELRPADRLRLAGAATAAFVLVHLTLAGWVPPTVAPALPVAIWAVVLLCGALAVTAADALVRAWAARRQGAAALS